MHIDKFSVLIKDLHSNRSKRLKIDADDAQEAHKKALSYHNELTQDIIKIVNANNDVVYTPADGFAS
jgi:hypothetical protein